MLERADAPSSAATTASIPSAARRTLALRGDPRTLVEQTVDWLSRRIDERSLRSGARVPSIRELALERGISRFTVVEAYDRLVARGYLESRRGSGFYVRTPAASGRATGDDARRGDARGRPPTDARRIDARWLMRNLFQDLPAHHMPGSGLPPPGWIDTDLLASSVRGVGRAIAARDDDGLLGYGNPQGLPALRTELARRFAQLEIGADPSQIVTTGGATQALDLIARAFVAPGDTVLVDDPAWFLVFALFEAHGARVVGVPRLADGPDLAALERLVVAHRPRCYVLDSVVHNPTSSSVSSAKAYRILQLAEAHDFTIVEDDVYGDLHPGSAAGRGTPAIRLASLDQLKRVIYVGSFSKTLSANLRVGFVACAPEHAARLAEHKMLAALTTPELGERVVARVLADGHYRKHVERLRTRLDGARDRAIRSLERVGLTVDRPPAIGMFLWARAGDDETGIDTNAVAARLFDQGYLLAPGSLFSPSQLPSARMRFNVATSSNPGMLDALARALQTLA